MESTTELIKINIMNKILKLSDDQLTSLIIYLNKKQKDYFTKFTESQKNAFDYMSKFMTDYDFVKLPLLSKYFNKKLKT